MAEPTSPHSYELPCPMCGEVCDVESLSEHLVSRCTQSPASPMYGWVWINTLFTPEFGQEEVYDCIGCGLAHEERLVPAHNESCEKRKAYVQAALDKNRNAIGEA